MVHFFPKDKDFSLNPDSVAFVKEHFQNARSFDIDAALLKYAVENATLQGAFLEMGVCTGRTINFIAALKCDQTVYGFDSFEGLPEDWHRNDIQVPKGMFSTKDKSWIPMVLHNVTIIKGLFADTLRVFKQRFLNESQPIAFLHIDCDLYSSTRDVFEALSDCIVPGTIILFDELYNFSSASEHEFKAFQEFLEKTKKKARWIGFNRMHEQAVAEIVE